MEKQVKKKAVISLGGSILVRGENDAEYIRSISSLIKGMTDGWKFGIIVGGGRTARSYIGIGRECGADEASLDELGIAATRLNARLLMCALGVDCYPSAFETIEEGIAALGSFRIVVGGGTHAGHSTDAVSALFAERWGADVFLNLTSVNGAYTSDPAKVPDAKRIDRISRSDLVDLVSSTRTRAGSHSVMDPLAARIIERSEMNTMILNGRDLKSVGSALEGGDFDGTIVGGV
ncbi:MAG: UMP kinase [Candidatus Thermoplasmatota archaeon]|nr:UMP kinase [Candidatus Thermoplasmatota archaeon]